MSAFYRQFSTKVGDNSFPEIWFFLRWYKNSFALLVQKIFHIIFSAGFFNYAILESLGQRKAYYSAPLLSLKKGISCFPHFPVSCCSKKIGLILPKKWKRESFELIQHPKGNLKEKALLISLRDSQLCLCDTKEVLSKFDSISSVLETSMFLRFLVH